MRHRRNCFVAQPVDRKAGLAQADGQAVAELGIVFNEQYAHGRILSASHPPAGEHDPGKLILFVVPSTKNSH